LPATPGCHVASQYHPSALPKEEDLVSRHRIALISAVAAAAIAATGAAAGAAPAYAAAHAAPGSHFVSAPLAAPRAIDGRKLVRIKYTAANATYYSQLQNVANNDCLNGTTALVYLTPCDVNDLHMWWEATEYDVDGYLAYMLTNSENGLCLNGSLDPSHAEVILTACDTSDPDLHTLWYPLGIGDGTNGYSLQDEYANVSAIDYCLNGSTDPSHAEVIITPCNTSDDHMTWNNDFPY
jgi:hypothetical protein